jgi:hypothetical protein
VNPIAGLDDAEKRKFFNLPGLELLHLGLSARNKSLHQLRYCSSSVTIYIYRLEKTSILVTGCGGPWDCETSRLSHFLDNRFTDGGKVVSLTRRPPFTPIKVPGIHFR